MRQLIVPLLSSIALLACAHPGAPAQSPRTPAATTVAPLPPAPTWLGTLDAGYEAAVRVPGLEDRRFQPEHWWRLVDPLIADPRRFRVEELGRSVEGRPLRYVAWGEGDTDVLLWSQMHGDESTASMALADLLRFLAEHGEHPLVTRLREATTLHLLPIVNPDGAARFQRRNAQGIDINRDARALASPEARVLHGLRERVRPAYGFNLHDQQVGYRAGRSELGTAIALLAPPFNEAREVDATRARAIELAVVVRSALEPYIAGRIARWDDTYNPRAFGDLTAAAGVSTLLIESGGIEGDPQKQRLRKLNFLALAAALDAIATGSHAGLSHAPYQALPTNGQVWPDLLVSGGTLVLPGRTQARVDILVDFSDPLLERGGSIEDVGDLGEVRARRAIDATGLYIHPLQPAPGAPVPVRADRLAPRTPAWFQLSRDPAGRDVVWTLAGDVDPARPSPPG